MVIHVELGASSYDIELCRGALARAGELINLNRKVLVVTDSGVPAKYAHAVATSAKEAHVLTVPQGEASKSFETLQKARQDLIGEIQAVIEYDAHIHSTNNSLARQTWISIKNEELVHIGELLGLLNYLDPEQKQFVQKGLSEFMERQK